jgi:hypothetical protein
MLLETNISKLKESKKREKNKKLYLQEIIGIEIRSDRNVQNGLFEISSWALNT